MEERQALYICGRCALISTLPCHATCDNSCAPRMKDVRVSGEQSTVYSSHSSRICECVNV